MAIAATIDTLAYAKRLIDAGMPQKQAEVQAEILSEIIEEKLVTKPELHEENHGTKESIQKLEEKMESRFHEMQHRFNELDAKIQLKNAELKADIVKWIVGISAAQTAVIFSIVASIFKIFH